MEKEGIMRCEARKVQGGNYMKSCKYNAKNLELYVVSSKYQFLNK